MSKQHFSGVERKQIKAIERDLNACHHRMAQLLKQSKPGQVSSMAAKIKELENKLTKLLDAK